MSDARLFFYVQHLLGIGHLVRAARIARAAAASGFEVTVAVGGALPGDLDFGGSAVVRLPPVKAGPGGFGDLVTPDGQSFDRERQAERRDALLRHVVERQPDILLVEAFPFGRRAMRFELLPLLEAVRARDTPPIVVSSVRDILQRNAKPGRDDEIAALVQSRFDRVIVHGDPGFCPFECSFPLASALGDKIAYSGLVGPEPATEEASSETFDVVVSVGGGAVGGSLIEAALAAKPLTRLAGARWLVVAGPNAAEFRAEDGPGVTVRAFVPDLAARLRRTRLSISQSGYNTAADLLAAPACRAVLVPYAGGGETEQGQRAALMEERGWAVRVDPDAATPARLAEAIDAALALPDRLGVPPLDGARRTCDLLHEALRAAHGGHAGAALR